MKKHLIFLILFLLGGCYFTHAQQESSLDGPWQIIFDEENIGRDEGWNKSELFDAYPDIDTIQVPGAWELTKKDYEGVAFYKKTFDVPAEWEDKVIRLQFGAVNYLSEIWLNDEVVGYNEGGFTPFEFRVDEMIKVGAPNHLTMRVLGAITLSDKEVDGIKKMETAQWRGGITGGIWQPVTMVATDYVYVDDVYIQPNIHDNSALLNVTLDHTDIKGIDAEITISITDDGNPSETVASVTEKWILHPGVNTNDWKLDIPNTKYWSPDDANLYRATVSISINGIVSDQWSERWGMRELTIKDKDFYLNAKPIYIKATFFEGVYPNGIAYPDSEEMIRKEIRLAKEAGFNMIRPWRRPPAPIWLDIADEMGVLVVGSPALECMTLPLSTPYLPARVEHEIRESVLRDRNRACVVQWELFNELHRPVLNQLMRPMANLTRTLDPTRLILDESGGWAYGANMYLPNEYEPTKFNDIHNYPGPFISNDRYDGYLAIGMTKEEKAAHNYNGPTPGKNVVPGLMSFVSELGYGSLPELTEINRRFEKEGNPLTPAYRYHKRLDQEQRKLLHESGFSELYPDMKQFYLDQQQIHGTANKRMIEAVRANPDVDGYCIHALSAGDWILGAGLIDMWRNPKSYAYEGTKQANHPQIVSIRVQPRNIYSLENAALEIIGINDLSEESAMLEVRIESVNERKFVYTKSLRVDYKNRVSQLLEDVINSKKLEGAYRVTATLKSLTGNVITSNAHEFNVYNEKALTIRKNKVGVMDIDGPLAHHLKKVGSTPIQFNANMDKKIPLIVTGKNHDGVASFIRDGGIALYLEGVHKKMDASNNSLPFMADVHRSRGLWTCIPHLVHDHPFFKGLPVNEMMRNEYENVWPTSTLRSIEIEGNPHINSVVASIGFDWFSRGHQLHYSGPGASWWGSEVFEAPLGKGRFFVSQLHIVKNLGKDPVADLYLKNVIHHLTIINK
ncbi:MAG: beta-galactosidase [Saprospiraceae bacterium]|jgi:beta-galactosidase